MIPRLFSPENMPFSLPLLIALAVTLSVFLLFRNHHKKVVAMSPPVEGAAGSSSWITQQGAASDRRTSLRREGTMVKILASSPAFTSGTNPGYVLDRSTSGLRLAMQAGMAKGSSMQIRATHAPDSTPWVTVIVRNCKDTGEHYELGCEFEKTLPWNVLLLFG